ncbi:tantalus [Haematobia irritans]|uniref:tantalus n=1 Tax=Haematobia irritans TaxID=7368 RepID=UPI003F504C3C
MMEGIVYGIANINFRQGTLEFNDENCTPNWMESFSQQTDMALSATPSDITMPNQIVSNEESIDSNSANEDDWQTDDDIDSVRPIRSKALRKSLGDRTFGEKRQLPSRASKDNFLSTIKRRTIMKPAKHNSSLKKDFSNMKPAEIKKIYLNKKLTNFRPSSLETIFEETPNGQNSNGDGDDDDEEYEQVRFIGARKLRRALNCTDGFVLNKALIKKRRAKIKKTFGRRLSLKKISLEDFMEKLNNSMEEQKLPDEVNDHKEVSIDVPDKLTLDSTIYSTSMSSNNPTPTTDAFINIPITPTFLTTTQTFT